MSSDMHVSTAENLVRRLEYVAGVTPDKLALRLVSKLEEPTRTIGYGRLWRAVRGLASSVAAVRGLDSIGVECESAADAAVAVLACFQAGIPCTVLPPSASIPAYTPFDSASAVDVLVSDYVLTDRRRVFPGQETVCQIDETFRILRGARERPASPPPDLEHALRQSTSGTTGQPRSVLVSHGNLQSACEQAADAYSLDASDEFVSWTPLHHSMGLMNGVLLPTFLGATSTIVDPKIFVRDPESWLRVISRYRGTYSSAPTFGYARCVDGIAAVDTKRLDLRSWQVARIAAGPLWTDVLERFTEKFAPAGFRTEALCPSYGLTEATLFVTATGPEEFYRTRAAEGHWSGDAVVSAGKPVKGTTLTIVDPESGEQLAPGEIGEILVEGPQVAKTIEAVPEAPETPEPGAQRRKHGRTVLSTGDLGMLVGDWLWVTGRRREMIKVHGVSHSLATLDRAIQIASSELSAAKVIALAAAESMQEALWIVIEAGPELGPEVDLRGLARAVAKATGVRAHRVMLVPPGAIPETHSGKPRRYECLRRIVDGDIKPTREWPDPA